MTASQIIFIIIVAILVIHFLFESWLEYLNLKNLSEKLPSELSDIYDSAKHRQSQQYEKGNIRFGFTVSTANLIIILLMLFWDGFAYVDRLAASCSTHYILQPIIFFAILGVALQLLNTPFSVYHTFVLEKKYGFSTTTPQLYITDTIKNLLLTAIIGGGILALVVWFYHLTTDWFWVWTWILMTVFSLFMAAFYSSLIVPLFNKQTPLEDGELKTAIMQQADAAGFQLDRIYTIDGSKRSTKANAYFTGMGRKKRIVLYDTLIKELSVDEIAAVLLHEIGHYRKKHIVTSMILSVIQSGVMLYIFSLCVSQHVLSQSLGVNVAGFHIGLIAFGILYTPISIFTGLGMNVLSRKHEYQADAFAGRFGKADALIGALKKLSHNNLSNLTPHPFHVFFHYSHPTLLLRIQKLKGSYS
ncbi:MAG: M48 family metallopeptidase [Bacteroidales bacterium]|jgi:STE24 endopeptidase|nr:M48 family metallopeptidase [Bacteroidales bacterium]